MDILGTGKFHVHANRVVKGGGEGTDHVSREIKSANHVSRKIKKAFQVSRKLNVA